ncbi:dipeptide ABC transporter ATP-binding protein [Halalkalirubrum salinum]|uniref:dipeptide ABC transporter ATP-binding protein n=1 Tax=Halalkalirubrum salinum TaxID=2563889 RepID=UPI0010FB0F6B|nr:ABC transporter ATP-binding protein [Halalkalirubrum salinum]
MTGKPILEVTDLQTQFRTDNGIVRAVDGVSFTLHEREVLGLVGESGAGKSVAIKTVLGLIEEPGEIVGGEIKYKGETIYAVEQDADGTPRPTADSYTDAQIRKEIRGNEIAIILQDPMESLNPVYTIGSQIRDVIELNRNIRGSQAKAEAIEILREVGIPDPQKNYSEYPHEFSGGQRQRIMIAMALACEPSVIIADEPTTALDVTVEGQILDLVTDLRNKYDTSFIWVTHDMSVVAELCDRVNVMYLGEIVESAPVREIFYETKHPYTQALLRSIPRPDVKQDELQSIAGVMPSARNPPAGCRFHTRCPAAKDVCQQVTPPLEDPESNTGSTTDGHTVRCLQYEPFEADYQESTYIANKANPDGIKTDSQLPEADESETIDESDAFEKTGEPILSLKGVRKEFNTNSGLLGPLSVSFSRGVPQFEWSNDVVTAVDDVSLDVYPGETLGLVGESGCGKSTLAKTIVRLIEPTDGSVMFDGETLSDLTGEPLRKKRRDIQMVFQDPHSSLDPRMTIGEIIGEPMRVNKLYDKETRRKRVYELLEKVGLNKEQYNRYPHAFSGGQRQRVNLARALSIDPKVVVCDEPVSALDVSVQAQVLSIMKDLQTEFDLTYLFISHDLSVIRQISDRIAVMYLGRIVEVGSTSDVFSDPKHPYTRGLLESIPVPDPDVDTNRENLSGDVPSPINPPSGCHFNPRCTAFIEPEEYAGHPLWDETLAFIRAVERREFIADSASAVHEMFFTKELSNDALGSIVSEAIDLVVDGEWETAYERLESAFLAPSICTQSVAEYNINGDERSVLCHRYAPDRAGFGEETY